MILGPENSGFCGRAALPVKILVDFQNRFLIRFHANHLKDNFQFYRSPIRKSHQNFHYLNSRMEHNDIASPIFLKNKTL